MTLLIVVLDQQEVVSADFQWVAEVCWWGGGDGPAQSAAITAPSAHETAAERHPPARQRRAARQMELAFVLGRRAQYRPLH